MRAARRQPTSASSSASIIKERARLDGVPILLADVLLSVLLSVGRAAFPAGPPRRALYVSMFSPAHPLVPRWWSLESLLPRMGNAEPASLAVSLVPSNLQSKRWARVCEGGCAREVRGCDHGPEGVWAVAGARCGGDPHRGAQWSVRTQPVSALKRKRC